MAAVKKWSKRILGLVVLVPLLLIAVGTWQWLSFDTIGLPENHGRVQSELYAGSGIGQPLIVGLGGSEGDNAWASERWRAQRERFLAQGYAVLALGYFGAEGTPASLDRISLDGVHDAIAAAAADPRVDGRCIALIGGSKGAELALVLASRYDDIKAVVALVPSHVVFAGDTPSLATSSFTQGGQPVDFVPVPWGALPALMSGDLRTAYVRMLEDDAAVLRAAIPVERINGPVFLLSAREDEFWPSTEMSERIEERLAANGFRFHHRHLPVAGGHNEPLDEFPAIEDFLQKHFLRDVANGCARSP